MAGSAVGARCESAWDREQQGEDDVGMNAEQQRMLERYAALLAASPHNLISPADRDRVWERHVGEAARVVERLGPIEGGRWVDVGTGGGLPGLVLAVLRPEVEVVLLDATRKKIDAVAGFIDTLGIANATALVGRAEEVARQPDHRGTYDGGIARAVGAVTVSVELVRGFVAPGGELAIVRGGDGPGCVPILHRHAASLGVTDIHADGVPDAARATWLVRMRAEGAVPRWLPRPNGIPRSRPLED